MIRIGICNELFEGWELGRICETAKQIGYEGIELAPFTLAPRITDLSPDDLRQIRRTVEDSGLELIGLHWLLAKTEGLYLTSPDLTRRMKTADYLLALARATHELGGRVMVFGSPKQRDLLPGVDYHQAFAYALEVFSTIMPEIGAMDVDFCLEPLARTETNFLTSISQAVDLIEKVDHPNFKLHMDVKAQSDDPDDSVTGLIARYARDAGHFHAQDTNLLGPGMGEVDFEPILHALVASGYDRWVSVEVFDFSPGPEVIAAASFDTLKRELDRAYREIPPARRGTIAVEP